MRQWKVVIDLIGSGRFSSQTRLPPDLHLKSAFKVVTPFDRSTVFLPGMINQPERYRQGN